MLLINYSIYSTYTRTAKCVGVILVTFLLHIVTLDYMDFTLDYMDFTLNYMDFTLDYMDFTLDYTEIHASDWSEAQSRGSALRGSL